MRIVLLAAVLLMAASGVPGEAVAVGDEPYRMQCAKCHGDDGAADTPVGRAMKVPSLVGSEWADAEASAICDAVREVSKHKAVLGKLDDEALAAACRTMKDRVAGI